MHIYFIFFIRNVIVRRVSGYVFIFRVMKPADMGRYRNKVIRLETAEKRSLLGKLLWRSEL